MRYIFIGDVHGCLDELRTLISTLDLQHDDKLIFVGDLVDKGPNSLGVVRHVKLLLGLYPGSILIAGNHEEKASRMAKKGKFIEPWCEEATQSDWDFIDSLPLSAHFPEIKARVVHGGVSPRTLEKHPDLFEHIDGFIGWQNKLTAEDMKSFPDMSLSQAKKLINRARRVLYTRYVKAENGAMISLGEEEEGDPFWTEVYNGEHGFMIYGHSPWREVKWDKHAVGIDTGCVLGWKMTALVCQPRDRPFVFPTDCEVVQVQAAKKYALPLSERPVR